MLDRRIKFALNVAHSVSQAFWCRTSLLAFQSVQKTISDSQNSQIQILIPLSEIFSPFAALNRLVFHFHFDFSFCGSAHFHFHFHFCFGNCPAIFTFIFGFIFTFVFISGFVFTFIFTFILTFILGFDFDF